MIETNKSLAEVREEIAAKQDQLMAIMEEAGPDIDLGRVTLLPGDNAAKRAEIQRRNTELSVLGEQRDQLQNIETIKRNTMLEMERDRQPTGVLPHPGWAAGGNGNGNGHRGPSDLIRLGLAGYLQEHKAFRDYRQHGTGGTVEIRLPYADYKTLIQVAAAPPQAARQAAVDMAVEERTVADLMLQGRMASRQIDYYEETTFEPGDAVMVAEGAAKPEMDIAWTLRTETAGKAAANVPATKESIDDIAWMESTLRGRLAFAVRRREEEQILNGNGTPPNIRGILNRTGIQTQAKGTDPTPDAIYKAMQLVRGSAGLGFAEPTALVIHPADWTNVKLLRTTDGIYLWGNPSDEGPDRIWSLMVRQTTGMAAGTALVGAFRPHAEVWRREDVSVTISTEHGTFFIENKVLIQAESRFALAVYRPSAFCTVTGLV